MSEDWPPNSAVHSAVAPLSIPMKVMVFRVAHYTFLDVWTSCVAKYPSIAAPNIVRATDIPGPSSQPPITEMEVSVPQPEMVVVDGPSEVSHQISGDDEADVVKPYR